jgi:hypothetical protein
MFFETIEQNGIDMKKPVSPGPDRVFQPGVGGIRKTTAPIIAAAKIVKLPPARKREPIGLLEEHSSNPEAREVKFEHFNPAANLVSVAGSFNNWQPRATPMARERGGKWSTALLLQPGHYEYRFVVDGQWQNDPMARRFVANPFGGLNCIVEVKPITTAAESQP